MGGIKPRLGVNIDHVATLRQARGGHEPDPVAAAALAELAGADGITVHLREDRRHIQDRDLRILRETVQSRLNLEAAVSDEMLTIVVTCEPDQVTFVPERRQEVTTEGGLDVVSLRTRLEPAVRCCEDYGIEVSLFIDPEEAQIAAAAALGVTAVELHTGRYADARHGEPRRLELEALRKASAQVVAAGLTLHAGHGLNYLNTSDVARIPLMTELNIGHSIISRAVLIGLAPAVREMKQLIHDAVSR